jgi:hypothetical protein
MPNVSKTPFLSGWASLGLDPAKIAERAAHTVSSLWAASTGAHIPIKLAIEFRGFHTASFVVFYYWGGHIVITLQSFLEGFRVIVTSLNEWFARDIILHGDLGRMVGEMICTTRGRVDETTRNSRY